jgi:hypothetical protein
MEHDYRELKDAVGLDHFEGRSWQGWQHHVTLVRLDLPPGGGHRGYAAMVDGSGLMAACCCSHWMGGK